jgi:hypothetical protein
MTLLIRRIQTLIYAVFRFFVDDGLYAAVTTIWIGLVVLAGHMLATRKPTGLLLAVGLDVIFVASVILRATTTGLEKPDQVKMDDN